MNPDERRGRHRYQLVGQAHSQPLPFVVRRREVTADFDQRQKQCFNEALIAILIADLAPEKIEQVLVEARDTTIQVFSGEMLADTRAAPKAGGYEWRDILHGLGWRPYGVAGGGYGGPIEEHWKHPESDLDISINYPGDDYPFYSVKRKGSRPREYLAEGRDTESLRAYAEPKPKRGKEPPTLENVSGRGDPSERNRTEDERRAELFARGHNSGKQIVNVTLSGTTLAVMFHDGSIQRQTISYPATAAVSHILQVLDTTIWARDALENRLLNLSKRKPEGQCEKRCRAATAVENK